jgi:methylglutaconyl-CoA hydratase
MPQLLRTIEPPGVATLILNRPEVHNAFNDALIAELTQAFAELAADPAVRLLVLRGAGKSFSAGADLAWMQRLAGYSFEENLNDARALGRMLQTLYQFPRPTLAVVQGAALGGGVGLVAACDMAVASEAAVFGLSEVRLGLIPAVISPYVIAAIGERACRGLFLTGERFSAHEAYRLGLVRAVVPPAELDAAAGKLTVELLQGGPASQAAAKGLIRAVARRPLDDALVEETAMRIARQRASAEGREGLAAFLEKRKPGWAG